MPTVEFTRNGTVSMLLDLTRDELDNLVALTLWLGRSQEIDQNNIELTSTRISGAITDILRENPDVLKLPAIYKEGEKIRFLVEEFPEDDD